MSVHHRTLVAATESLSRRSVVVGLGFGGIAAALAASGWAVETRAQDATPSSQASMGELNALVVIYNHPEDPAAFQEYLLTTHLPLVYQVSGVQSLIVHAGMVTLEGMPGDVYQIGTVLFASQSEMEEALASEQGQVAFADVGNFATGGFSAYLAHVQTITDIPARTTPMA